MEETESQIVSAICDYLAARRHFFWRQNTAPTFDWKTNTFRRMPKHALKGVPDIILLKKPTGQFIGLEVKRKGGVVSEEQEDFMVRARDHGAAYHVVRSIDDVIALGL